MPDAIVVLKNDHKTVEKLFKKFEQRRSDGQQGKRELVDEIIKELSLHSAIEEQVFYPSVRSQLPDLGEDVLEAFEEHHIVKWTLDELTRLDADDERFDAKVTVLIEMVRHHVQEEESELFPEVRKGLGRKALQSLAEALEEAKSTASKEPQPAPVG